jgi:plasmid maintenance system antidote protein VapI
MPNVPTAIPDGPKIRELIRERGYSVTGFARRLGRHPQAIWNITGYEPPTSEKFIRQIARELGVRPSDISDMSEPEPKAPAA